jgi:transcription initiation factor TFIID subunit 11
MADIESDTFSSEDDSQSSTTDSPLQPSYTLINSLSPEEQLRYKAFREAGFKRNMMKRFCFECINQNCIPKFIIAMCGLAKVFVGELVEEAVSIQKEWNDVGALSPEHVHEAYRRLYRNNHNIKTKHEDIWNEDFI